MSSRIPFDAEDRKDDAKITFVVRGPSEKRPDAVIFIESCACAESHPNVVVSFPLRANGAGSVLARSLAKALIDWSNEVSP